MTFLDELDKRNLKYTFGELYRHFYPMTMIYVRFPVNFNLCFYFGQTFTKRFSFQGQVPYEQEIFFSDQRELLSKVDKYIQERSINISSSLFYKDPADNSEQLSF